MPTVEQSYQKYLQKVEKNITNDGISTDRGRFILLYNESEDKFVEMALQQRGVDDIRYIQHLLKLDYSIRESVLVFDHYDFKLPKDYFDLADARAKASKRICLEKLIDLWEVQSENISSILSDVDNKPSFEWREAPFTINSNQISVYTDTTFTIDEVLLDYYKYPNRISLIDPYNSDSKFDESIKIEWDDKALDRIISICAGEFDMNEGNPRAQMQITRQQK